jgi:putative zinc finger/helix-turn-helix YgiT family protein
MTGFCPNCEKETTLVSVKRTEELNIRGEIIPVEVEYFLCEECGREFEKAGSGNDPLEIAYKEYRQRKGMVQPEEIYKHRKKYGLTQKEFSNLLGIGIATLNRYENGALQDEAHDRILRLSMDPRNLLELIESNSGMLNARTKENIIERIRNEEKSSENLLDLALELYAEYEADLYSGYKKFDIEKFFQEIKYYCSGSGIFKTKLMKLLFYADFKHFKEYSISITGARYAHLPYGPVPDQFETWLNALFEYEPAIVKEEVWFHDNPGEIFHFLGQSDLSVFSTSELRIIATIKELFENYTPRGISEFSHKEKGYIETLNSKLISYRYAEDLQI